MMSAPNCEVDGDGSFTGASAAFGVRLRLV